MRLFISYARVDKYYCTQIVDMLDVHDVWFDNRLHAGQQWWDQIKRRLEWCDGFVYLLSPDSVASKYCRKEYEIAMSLGKAIFPILIQSRTQIPPDMAHIQYVDLSSGITTECVKLILNSIYIAEREGSTQQVAALSYPNGHHSIGDVAVLDQPATTHEAEMTISEAAQALDGEEYDRAVFLLKQAKASGYKSRYIDLDAMLNEAEDALEMQAYQREAEREYMPIAALVKHDRTRKLGCQAFRAFHNTFPDYDPDNLVSICMPLRAPQLEWVSVPAGHVKLKRNGRSKTHYVGAFEIAKYPVTNAQYTYFLDAPDGYVNEKWWDFSPQAKLWREEHPDPIRPKPELHNHPCVNACWYEAVAFSRWLSDRTGTTITLPSEQQWQRAAQGDDDRLFPWGNDFNPSYGNTREARKMGTTPVTEYAQSASPYGVVDMCGNVWEWCINNNDGSQNANGTGEDYRVIKGGSYIGTYQRAQSSFYYALKPECRYSSIGIRLIRLKV
ncbi:MAG: hypothetical protein CL610_11050 [Anaerolineaceae bacterium]|nr:hypothetical protein [Anaerolineaceae bacterium]